MPDHQWVNIPIWCNKFGTREGNKKEKTEKKGERTEIRKLGHSQTFI